MTAETNERRVLVPELKPCPFCGDIPESAVNETEDIWHLNVICPVSMTLFSQKDWNSRAAPAAPKPGPDDAFDFRAHLQRQREWSEKTFGPGARTTGVLDHIRKELIEVEREPNALSEWIDVVILALDGAWRAGHQPEQIIAALVAKQIKNESRNWPDWKTAAPGKAIEHVREPDDATEAMPKLFPIMYQWTRGKQINPGPNRIPWSIAELAYSAYSAQYGKSQTLERLAERGGFYDTEMDELCPGWRHG